MVTVFSLVEVKIETARPGFMSRSRRVLGIGRMTYPDFHLLQAKESQFQLQFLGVYYGGKIKVAKIYYIDIFVYIYKILIFMKLQDAEKTWELIRGQAGQSTVLRTTGFNVNEHISSDYRDAMNTTVEQEDRVVLRDLQEQIEGEAHFVFSGQIVRGDMFYANPSLKKAQLRVPQVLQLSQEKQYDHAA